MYIIDPVEPKEYTKRRTKRFFGKMYCAIIVIIIFSESRIIFKGFYTPDEPMS